MGLCLCRLIDTIAYDVNGSCLPSGKVYLCPANQNGLYICLLEDDNGHSIKLRPVNRWNRRKAIWCLHNDDEGRRSSLKKDGYYLSTSSDSDYSVVPQKQGANGILPSHPYFKIHLDRNNQCFEMHLPTEDLSSIAGQEMEEKKGQKGSGGEDLSDFTPIKGVRYLFRDGDNLKYALPGSANSLQNCQFHVYQALH